MTENLAATEAYAHQLRAELGKLEARRATLLAQEQAFDKSFWWEDGQDEPARIIDGKLAKVLQELDDVSDAIGSLQDSLDDMESHLALDDVWHGRNYAERY